MFISVIIPAYGRKDVLIRCLKSLDKNTDIEYEVCVIDDGSGLDENDVRMKSDVSYPLIWRSFDIQKGRAAARNEGISSTTGEIIVFLDSDMEPLDGFLEAHLKSHLKHPHTAAIGRIIWPEGGSFFKYVGARGVNKLKESYHVPPWYFVTGNVSIERKDLTSISPFDETLPGWGGEDLDLGMRLNEAGITFTFTHEAQSYHNFNGNLKTHIDRTFSYGCNTLPILIDRYPEISRITKIHLLDSVIWRFFINKLVFNAILFFTSVFEALPLPAILYDYLTFAAYARGWLKGKQT